MTSQMTRDEVAPGVTRYRLSTSRIRSMGFCATPYLVDDVLVDSGFAHVRPLVIRTLESRTIRAICCTHGHEDHTGNAGVLAERHGCPVYLYRAHLWRGDGVSNLPAYRRFYWGTPAPMEPLEIPDEIPTAKRVLRAVAAPGHSQTHVVLHDPDSGVVFTGDLFVVPGAAAVMRYEDPFELVRSLRLVADLEPSLLLSGHAVALEDPSVALRLKADRIAEVARRVIELLAAGMSVHAIARRVFHGGYKRDRIYAVITGREFSRTNFVRAVLSRQKP